MTGIFQRAKSKTNLACAALISAHIVLVLCFSFNTPIWESFDEPGHYQYVRQIAQLGYPPPLDSYTDRVAFDEVHQLPLYYLLPAWVVAWVDTSDNLQPRYSASADVWVVKDLANDVFPWHKTALAIRLARMVSTLYSALSVLLTFFAARTALPKRPSVALFATALHAFWPAQLFLGGAITNDIGIGLCGSLVFFFAVRLLLDAQQAKRVLNYVGIGIAAAASILTKDNGIGLVLFAVMVLLIAVMRTLMARNNPWHTLAKSLLAVLACGAVLAVSAVFVRDRLERQFATLSRLVYASNGLPLPSITGLVEGNTARTTNPLAPATVAAPAATAAPSTLQRIQRGLTFLMEGGFLGAYDSQFAAYGFGTIRLPMLWYLIARGAGVILLIGLLAVIWKRRHLPLLTLALLCICSVVLPTFARMVFAEGYGWFGGRFMTPAFSAFKIVFAVATLGFVGKLRAIIKMGILAGIGLVAIMSPYLVIQRAYGHVNLLDPIAQPEGIQIPTDIVFGDAIRLLGYSHNQSKASADGNAEITLYWRALRPIPRDQGLRIELFDIHGQSLERSARFTPGGNTFPTGLWKPGDTFSETYAVPLQDAVDAPTTVMFRPSWFDQASNETLSAACEPSPCEAKLGRMPVAMDLWTQWRWRWQPALYTFGDVADLLDLSSEVLPSGQLRVRCVWRARANQPPNTVVFLHTLSSDGKLVGQLDTQPRQGLYPTGLWQKDEVIVDYYLIDPPPSGQASVTVRLGLYDADSVQRLPITPQQDVQDQTIVVYRR